MGPAKYRFEKAYGKLYKYSEDQKAYVFVTSTQFRTKKAAVRQWEEYLDSCPDDAHDSGIYGE